MKFLSILLLVLLTPKYMFAADLNCQNIILTHKLQLGSSDKVTNGQVSKLQLFLKNFLELKDDAFIVTGVFGRTTQSYVRTFQITQGISPTGIIGSFSRETIQNLCGVNQSLPVTYVTNDSPDVLKLRGKYNQYFTYRCDPGLPPNQRTWGTEVYTDDSPICVAAIHSGIISKSKGGNVTFKMLPGQSKYKGSNRNGISTEDFESWDGSFAFVKNKNTNANCFVNGMAMEHKSSWRFYSITSGSATECEENSKNLTCENGFLVGNQKYFSTNCALKK